MISEVINDQNNVKQEVRQIQKQQEDHSRKVGEEVNRGGEQGEHEGKFSLIKGKRDDEGKLGNENIIVARK